MIDAALVRQLIATQFPHWAALPVRQLERAGWDNRTFRLGERMVVRLPSAAEYAAQVEKEQRWLPRLAPALPLAIPAPLAMGEPGSGYPWRWSIYGWIEGESAAPGRIGDLDDFARRLAEFLSALQGIDARDGPQPGAHNFHRGGSLATYDAEARRAIDLLEDRIDADAAAELWQAALATAWDRAPVWVHGDMSAGNLLLRGARLAAVLDFGNLAVGDPSCDLAVAWTLLEGESRRAFRKLLPLDPATWARGRAWTLWKAAIVAAGMVETNAVEWQDPWRVIDAILS